MLVGAPGTAAPRPSDSDGIFSKIRFKRSRSPRMIDEQNIDHLPRYSGGKITNVQKRWKRKYKSDFNFEQSTYIYVEYTSSYTYILFLTCSYLQYSGCPFYKMTSGKESSSTQSIDQYENIFPISKYISNVQIDQYENIFPVCSKSSSKRTPSDSDGVCCIWQRTELRTNMKTTQLRITHK